MLNKQITEGRLTAHPELRMTPSGVPVCRFTIASDEDKKREDGSRDTDFIDCVAWRERAEFVAKFLTKGRLIIVEGRPKPRRYKDKNDVTHKVTELRVDAVYFADSKRDDAPGDQPSAYAAPTQSEAADGFEEVLDDEDFPF